VGCSVKEPDVAVEFLPLLLVPQILFSGFFVPPDLIPVWLRWLQYIFPLTYAVKLVMVAEFDNACNGLEPNYCDGTFVQC
jgi:ABC-type multidrug transport system permease subunit